MIRCCCCFTVDEGYLFPTLLSAMQLRRSCAPDVTDVLIICIGTPTPSTRIFAQLCQQFDIRFTIIPPAAINNYHPMHARFFIDDVLDQVYDTIVYLDGDTQIAGSIEPLVRAELKAGMVFAAPDPSAIMIYESGAHWRDQRAYFNSIGLSDAALGRYFNSGVLRASRSDWAAISRECLRTIERSKRHWRFPDQDILNLCVGDRHAIMSLRWNFPIFLLNSNVQNSIHPVVYHFMSNPRPWQGAFAPWRQRWTQPYHQLIEDYPQLAPFLEKMPLSRMAKYAAQQRVKQVIERYRYRKKDVIARIASLEAAAVL